MWSIVECNIICRMRKLTTCRKYTSIARFRSNAAWCIYIVVQSQSPLRVPTRSRLWLWWCKNGHLYRRERERVGIRMNGKKSGARQTKTLFLSPRVNIRRLHRRCIIRTQLRSMQERVSSLVITYEINLYVMKIRTLQFAWCARWWVVICHAPVGLFRRWTGTAIE